VAGSKKTQNIQYRWLVERTHRIFSISGWLNEHAENSVSVAGSTKTPNIQYQWLAQRTHRIFSISGWLNEHNEYSVSVAGSTKTPNIQYQWLVERTHRNVSLRALSSSYNQVIFERTITLKVPRRLHVASSPHKYIRMWSLASVLSLMTPRAPQQQKGTQIAVSQLGSCCVSLTAQHEV
jgi:acylphosphatase